MPETGFCARVCGDAMNEAWFGCRGEELDLRRGNEGGKSDLFHLASCESCRWGVYEQLETQVRSSAEKLSWMWR